MRNRKYYGLKEFNGSFQIMLHKTCVQDGKGRKADWHGTKKKAIQHIDRLLTLEKKKFLSENYKTDENGYFLNEKLENLPKSKYYGVRLTQNKKKYYIRITKAHSVKKKRDNIEFFG